MLSRRNFLKTNFLGSLGLGLGLPFSLSSKESNQVESQFTLNQDEPIDWNYVREQFLFRKNQAYFNTASLGPSPKSVVETMQKVLLRYETNFGAKGSNGHPGDELHQQIASYLNCEPSSVALTRNTTEGMNIAARSLPLKKGDEVLITTHEHVGGASPWLALQKDIGIVVKLVELDLGGEENFDRIQAAVSSKTKAVSFSHICCTTGMRLDAKAISEFCRSKGIYSVVDGAQAAGMIKLDLEEIQPDFYCSSGHKWLYGPKGTGFIYINPSIMDELNASYVGSYSDSSYDLKQTSLELRDTAQRFEYGTRSIVQYQGLNAAFDFMNSIGIDKIEARGMKLANKFKVQLNQIDKVEVLSPESEEYASSIVSFRVEGIDNLELARELFKTEDRVRVRGVYENDLNAVRLSFAVFNQPEEIEKAISNLKKLI